MLDEGAGARRVGPAVMACEGVGEAMIVRRPTKIIAATRM
jgi:hypothetical protein